MRGSSAVTASTISPSCPACPLHTGHWHHSTASPCRLCVGHIPRSGVTGFKDSARIQRHQKQRHRPVQLNHRSICRFALGVIGPHPQPSCGVPVSRVVYSAFLVTNEDECFFHAYSHLNGIFLNQRFRSLGSLPSRPLSKCCRSPGFQRQAEPHLNVLQVTATVASRHPHRLLVSSKSRV